MGKKRYKGIRAGCVVSEIMYEQATGTDSDIARQAKMQYSSMARQKINNDTATYKLSMKLAASFCEDDYWCTLTYDDLHLPDGPDARHIAKVRAALFFKALNAARKRERLPLIYAYGTESVTEHGKRLHHHCIINASGYTRDKQKWKQIWRRDLEQLKSLWRQGDIHVETFRMAERRMDERTPQRKIPSASFDDAHLVFRTRNVWDNIASYVVKERRERDSKPVGEHAWNCSRSMKKPLITNEWVEQVEELCIPPGAIELANERASNGFGSYQWVKYILPPATQNNFGFCKHP